MVHVKIASGQGRQATVINLVFVRHKYAVRNTALQDMGICVQSRRHCSVGAHARSVKALQRMGA
eukprot:scaffold94539_cov21-Tisochrysis_lutea.AAC.5